MAYEVEYIPVGEGEKSGDAIVLRFGNLMGDLSEQTIIVIDGGFEESGKQIVEHIKQYYGTNIIDLVISTHPDMDHISGLCYVLENSTVHALLMHKPWEHADYIKTAFKNKNLTSAGLKEKIEKSLQHASDLEAIAIRKGIQIMEPFQGVTGYNHSLHVLGPSKEYYETLLPLFRDMPAPLEALEFFLGPLVRATQETVKWIEDHIGLDLLNDDVDTTSAENNTSTIILFNIDGHKLLFTADAGKTALLQAADYATNQGMVLTDLNFLDVPHHGSKRNISSKVLSRIKAQTAFISASKDSPKHPSKKVTNALKKHGTKVYINRGKTIKHHYNAPDRIGWIPIQEEPFHSLVEE